MNQIIKTILGYSFVISSSTIGQSLSTNAQSVQSLSLSYPPQNHTTTADQIFFIGTAPPSGDVLINGEKISRSNAGHFAPSFPLNFGENQFIIRHETETIEITITRLSLTPKLPQGVAFAEGSLMPNVALSRLPHENICFTAVAPTGGEVSVTLAQNTIPLLPQVQSVQLPENSAVLTGNNQPIVIEENQVQTYQGCASFPEARNLGYPTFHLSLNGDNISTQGAGKIEILSTVAPPVIEVTATAGVARTGASTSYSRLTPLPQGTRASVTGSEGDWWRLDYGGWIKKSETRLLPSLIPPQTMIRSVLSRVKARETEIIFPLQIPVPIALQQRDNLLTLTLYNTIAQTDTIYVDSDPIIHRLDWQQITPNQVEYTLTLNHDQQWGYDVKYEGTSLILTLRHPPQINRQSLANITVLLDPGHGGTESGAVAPTGYPEKDANLVISQLLKTELITRGINVLMTRETDETVSLRERMTDIAQTQPTLALSIHYNALPDNGDAINTAGVSAFWYHEQAHSLAVFLEDYLVQKLNRPSYGVYWNNLALTRPHVAPSVLLELGFLINPEEFEWISNPTAQKQLAETLADGIVEWLYQVQ